MKYRISVVIPLYNKQREITAAVCSALNQTCRPEEVIVINDGSTDGSLQAVRGIDSPLLRVIDQSNRGVAAARNRGAALAKGDYVAFLDGDDVWRDGFLEKITSLIERYPDCGAYATAFSIVTDGNVERNASPEYEGIVKNYFAEAMTGYICQPSTTVIPKQLFARLGGFPEGMKLGEDQYMWAKIAENHKVCFSPEPLVRYNRSAANRSTTIFRSEDTRFSFEDLYHDDGNDDRNEYLARCAIGKALFISSRGDTKFGRRTEKFFDYTRRYRFGWWKLRIINRLPRFVRPWVYDTYQRLAWMLARKGL